MPESQTTQTEPGAAAKGRPWGERKRVLVEAELQRRYRRIGIAAVAAAAGARARTRKLEGR